MRRRTELVVNTRDAQRAVPVAIFSFHSSLNLLQDESTLLSDQELCGKEQQGGVIHRWPAAQREGTCPFEIVAAPRCVWVSQQFVSMTRL